MIDAPSWRFCHLTKTQERHIFELCTAQNVIICEAPLSPPPPPLWIFLFAAEMMPVTMSLALTLTASPVFGLSTLPDSSNFCKLDSKSVSLAVAVRDTERCCCWLVDNGLPDEERGLWANEANNRSSSSEKRSISKIRVKTEHIVPQT